MRRPTADHQNCCRGEWYQNGHRRLRRRNPYPYSGADRKAEILAPDYIIGRIHNAVFVVIGGQLRDRAKVCSPDAIVAQLNHPVSVGVSWQRTWADHGVEVSGMDASVCF